MTTAPSRQTESFDADAFSRFEHDGWENTATGWHHHFQAVSTQAVGALLDAADVPAEPSSAGKRVLDIATGPGYAAGEAARRSAEGHGIDFAAAQVALAAENFPAAQFRVGDAEALPYDSEHFDAVVINFGLQHFPNPEHALTEAYRVLRPGGRIAYTVWAKPPEAVGFHIVNEAIAEHGNPDAPIPAGPPYYRFSEVAESVRVLLWAGFKAPRVLDVPQTWRVADVEAVLTGVADGTVRAGALLRVQTDAARTAIAEAVARAAEPYHRDGVFELPMPAVLATATKLA